MYVFIIFENDHTAMIPDPEYSSLSIDELKKDGGSTLELQYRKDWPGEEPEPDMSLLEVDEDTLTQLLRAAGNFIHGVVKVWEFGLGA